LSPLLFDELDDQNGVLSRKPHRCQESDLEIHVVGKPAKVGRQQRAKHTQRQHQEVDKGDGPAFVQSRHAQEDHEYRKRIENRPLGRCHPLLVGKPGPVIADSRWQLRGDVFHGLHGIAGTYARCRLTPDVQGRKTVKSLQPWRSARPAGGGKRGKGHHLPGRITHVKFFQVLGQHAVGSVRLNVNPFDSPALNEVVDVGTAESGRDGAVNGVDGCSLRACCFPVHVNPEFGHILHAIRPDSHQSLVFCRHAEELVAGVHQSGVPDPATVHQLEINSLSIAQFDNGRGWKGENHGVADFGERPHGPVGNGHYFQVRAVAKLPTL